MANDSSAYTGRTTQRLADAPNSRRPEPATHARHSHTALGGHRRLVTAFPSFLYGGGCGRSFGSARFSALLGAWSRSVSGCLDQMRPLQVRPRTPQVWVDLVCCCRQNNWCSRFYKRYVSIFSRRSRNLEVADIVRCIFMYCDQCCSSTYTFAIYSHAP